MTEENRKLLAGCVVLYQPNASLVNNIWSYINYVDVLYIIDNSEIAESKLIETICLISKKIIYIPQNSNIGIASALNLAAGLAFGKYNWMLTMDQDSCFIGGLFFDLWTTNLPNEDIGLFAASYTSHQDRWQREYSTNFNEIHFAVTSGNIVNLKAWQKIKGYEDKLFIDEVDHDYCLKLRKNRYKILITKQILLQHTVGEVYQKEGGNLTKKKIITLHKPIRYYYISRNVLFLCRKYFFIDSKFVSARFFYLIRRFFKILVFYPDKSNYLKYFFAGIRDFMLSRYNKYSNR